MVLFLFCNGFNEEEIFWEKGIWGLGTPFSLQFSVWYYLTLLMGVHAHNKHRAMMFSDVSLSTNSDKLEYLS